MTIKTEFEELYEKYAVPDGSAEWKYANNYDMPLTPSILKKSEVTINKVYHVTDGDGLFKIAKLQGRRIDIPTFTKGSEGLSTGARTDTEFLIVLSGKSSFSSLGDFVSKLDRNGHRWIDHFGGKNYVVNNKFSIKIKKIMDAKYGPLSNRAIDEKGAEFKRDFIKTYFDEAKKLMTPAVIQAVMDDLALAYMGYYTNDEVLLHNFKIEKIFRVVDDDYKTYQSDYTHDLGKRDEVIKRKLGVPVTSWITITEVANLNIKTSKYK